MRRAAGAALLLLLVGAPAAAEEEPFTASDRHLVVDEGVLQVEWARRLGAWGATKLIVEFRDDDFDFTRCLHFQIPETSQLRSYRGVRDFRTPVSSRRTSGHWSATRSPTAGPGTRSADASRPSSPRTPR